MLIDPLAGLSFHGFVIMALSMFMFSVSLMLRNAPQENRPAHALGNGSHIIVRQGSSIGIHIAATSWLIWQLRFKKSGHYEGKEETSPDSCLENWLRFESVGFGNDGNP